MKRFQIVILTNHAGQFIRLRNKFVTVILHRILCFHIGIKSTRFFIRT